MFILKKEVIETADISDISAGIVVDDTTEKNQQGYALAIKTSTLYH